MSDDLRDAIARAIRELDQLPYLRQSRHHEAADAVLAMPEIVDMLALRRMCGDLSVEQVALGLRYSSFIYSRPYNAVTDDEKAIANWRGPT